MSQASRTLKQIATSDEYKTLVEAVESANYETVCQSYIKISELLEEKEKEILEKIQALPRQNKDEECQRFKAAFALRASTTLPKWHWLYSKLNEQRLLEGVVFSFGSKGDPLVKTPEGKVVVISGVNLEEGARITFRIISEGEKIDFGRVFELTPDYLYLLLNQHTQTRVRDSLDSIGERMKKLSRGLNEPGLAELSSLLKELEDTREQTNDLKESEKERALSEIQAYRRRLLRDSGIKQAFEFLSQQEEQEIAESCQGDEQQIAEALSAPGLFRRQAHEVLKAKLLAGEELRGYSEVLGNMESKLNSMNDALEFMEFKSKIDKVYPPARSYLEKTDRLFSGLHRRAMRVAITIAEDRIYDTEDIHFAIREAFSGKSVCSEIGRTFNSAAEFYTLRKAVIELKTILGDNGSVTAELAIKPYLSQKVDCAFTGRPH